MHFPHLVPFISNSLSTSRPYVSGSCLCDPVCSICPTNGGAIPADRCPLKEVFTERLCSQLHTDMDSGDGRTKYTLEGEGVGSVFVIDSNTGNIHVTKALDREEKDQYRLIATATDRQTGRALEPSSEFIIRVQDINDNPPVFPNEPYVAMVPEMANIGRVVKMNG